MKRCEFATIQPSLNDNNLPILKKEATSYGNNTVNQSTYHLPGDISLNIDDILRVSGISQSQPTGLCSNSSQSTLYMGGSEYEIPQNYEFTRAKASSTSSLTSPSLYSSNQYTFSNNANTSIINATLKRVSVISSEENFLHYELYNPTLQLQSLHYFEQNSNELLRQLDIVSQTEQNKKNQYLRGVQDTIRSYAQLMNEISSIFNQGEIAIDEKFIETIHTNIRRVRTQTLSSKYYTYSIYVLDSNQVYREVQKGLSQNLVNFLSGSQQSYTDHILRFGDAEIFDNSSRTVLSLSRLQQIINAQKFNIFNIVADNNLMMCRADGKKVPVNCQSSFIPLSEPIFRQQKALYYAYMRITEINVDEQYCEQSCAESSCSNSPNSATFDNSRMYEEYLQNCQEFQEKYYGKGSQRKKRYRKTKAQVEQELKYYLSLNTYANNSQM